MKKILIKVSGDVSRNREFLDFANKKSSKGKVVIICGAGTQINNVLSKKGFEIRFGKHGRIIESLKEHKIIKKVLEDEKDKLKEKLNNEIYIKIPLIKVDSIECDINADKLVKTYYLGFDEIYIFTIKERIKSKENYFKEYPKVRIIGISNEK